MTILRIPYAELSKGKFTLVPAIHLPYPIRFYRPIDLEEGPYVLKEIAEEVQQLTRRYAVLFPEVHDTYVEGEKRRYRCMVEDEKTGITRGVLERIGYELLESEFTPWGLYWIELKTYTEVRKKR